ncbi:MAG TPA: histidine kinase, partial [Bacteroidia bacterium]|nr:histidine kinase [Bacteroidia bacterium]
KLLAIERERNRISEDLHDDLGAGLSSIAMMTGVMRELITDEDSKNTADEVSTEANELVARMREIIWSMNSKNDTVENMLTYINDYCHRYLAKNKIEIRMQMPEYVPDINITSEARENTFLVIKETLHNAVKHAQSGKFSFQATLDTHWLTIKLNDHGKGFDLNAINRFGNGMLNMEQRIHKISGKFLITSEPGQGTQTHIEIPIS